MPDSLDDKHLHDLIKKDTGNFSLLYEEYYSVIFNYVLKRIQGFDQARDITSEVFIKAFLNIKRYQWRGVSFKYWLYRIATNELNLYYRAKKYRPELLQTHFQGAAFDFLQTDLETEKLQAEQETEKHEQFLAVSKAMKHLPSHYQEALSLRYFEKLSIRGIALILNKKEGTVKSLISRGLKKIRAELDATKS